MLPMTRAASRNSLHREGQASGRQGGEAGPRKCRWGRGYQPQCDVCGLMKQSARRLVQKRTADNTRASPARLIQPHHGPHDCALHHVRQPADVLEGRAARPLVHHLRSRGVEWQSSADGGMLLKGVPPVLWKETAAGHTACKICSGLVEGKWTLQAMPLVLPALPPKQRSPPSAQSMLVAIPPFWVPRPLPHAPSHSLQHSSSSSGGNAPPSAQT